MSETRATGSIAKDIFIEVCDLPPDHRAAEVDRRTAHDARLRAAVLSLLDAHDRAGAFLAGRAGAAGPGATVPTPEVATDFPQRQLGPYKILQIIGEGGFGTVYMADQEQPVRRRVALKVIKVGMDTRGVIARFEQERQALALMEHANIAKVFDAGTTPDGRPFFVMELVRGTPLTEYCDANHLGIRERLELFAQVCSAVQHAHQKGVIHRDIKPSNVLVTRQDDKPVAKVIDFGIAKATQARLTEKTVFTEMRQLIGTPEYMSPEQAEGSMDIDTRTDVYALGVLLYELLTGTTPFDARELRSKAFGEMQRVIREVDPPKPSTRLSAARDTLPTVAARRGIEPRKLTTLLRGDLDWVVMKALDKDRARRYETANALAADVQRFLADEPVSAGPPGAAYQLRKFAYRNRLLVGSTAVVLIVLLGGVISTTIFAIRAQRERNEAVTQRDRAEAAKLEEQKAREFERGTDKFLVDMFESIDPRQAQGKPVLVKDILDRAVQRIDANPPEHRRPEGSLRFIFGTAYSSIGLPEQAHKQLEKAAEIYQAEWGDADFRTPKVLNNFGQVSGQLGRFDEAERVLTKASELNRKIHGPDHAETIASENALADVYLRRGKTAQAEALLIGLLERARRLSGADSEDALSVASGVVSVQTKLGKYAEAEALARESLEAGRKRHGEDHPYAIAFRSSLAEVLRTQGRVTDAEPIQREARDAAGRVYGPDHPTTLTVTNNLALTLDALGRYDEAETLYRDVIERRTRVLGEDHPSTLTARNNHALLLQNTGRLDQAEPIFRDVVERGRRTSGEDHPNTLLWAHNLAWLLAQRGDVAGADALYRDLVPRARRALGPKHPITVSLLMRYGHTLAQQQRLDDAEAALAEAYAGAQALGIAAAQGGYAANYGTVLVRREKHQEALPVLLQADEALRRAPKRDAAAERRVADALVTVFEKLGPPDRAEEWRRKRDAISTQPATTTSPATQP